MIEEKKVNLYTNLIYFIVVVGLCVLRICSGFGLFAFMGKAGSYVFSVVTQVGLCFFLPLIMLKCLTKAPNREVFRFCSYKKTSSKIIVASFVLGFVVFFLNIYFSTFFNSFISLFGYKHGAASEIPGTWWGLLLGVICTAVLPAICEETLHRGLVLNGNSFFGLRKSIVITSVLFGLLHMNIEQCGYAILIGLLLGHICCGCGSIWPSIIVHFMNNFLSVFLSWSRSMGWSVGNIFGLFSKFMQSNPLIGFVVFFLLLVLLMYAVHLLVGYMFRETFTNSFVKKQKQMASIALRESFFHEIDSIKKDNANGEDDEILRINASDFQAFVNQNLANIFKEAKAIEEKDKKFKMLPNAKVFYWGSIALGAIMTLLSFIWGLL